MRMPRLAALGALLSLAAAALVASPAQAAAVDYVALGDSYSSGVGAGAGSLPCVQSDQGYPVLWRQSHEVSSFRNATCAGAVTSTVLQTQVDQLSAETDFVTITIGGNDVNFASTVIGCTFSNAAQCEATARRNLEGSNLAAKLDQTYAAIKAGAPNARVVVLGYPNLYETTQACNSWGEPSRANRQIIAAGGDELEAIIKGRAEAAGFTFASVKGLFAGHNICSRQAWINGSLFVAGANAYHPNAQGYRQGYLAALNAVTG